MSTTNEPIARPPLRDLALESRAGPEFSMHLWRPCPGSRSRRQSDVQPGPLRDSSRLARWLITVAFEAQRFE